MDATRPVSPDLARAFEGIWYLTQPGEYGFSDEDPKVGLIRELGGICRTAGVHPVVIGGIAVIVNGYHRQTEDVDLLVGRSEALRLIHALEATPGFRKVRLDRFRHPGLETGVDLCVEGELTSPHHADRFPAPAEVERLPRDPLPVIGLIDLLALKAKSSRLQDQADFVRLLNLRHLGPADRDAIRSRVTDPALQALVDELFVKAREELERERLMGPPDLGPGV